MAKARLFGAVDLGEDQFVVLAASAVGNSFEVHGCGTAKARGYERGLIIDIDTAAQALAGAVRQAEIMAGGSIDGNIVAAVSGEHLSGKNRRSHVKIQGGAVTEDDVDLAMDTLQAFPLPAEMEILHVLEQEFVIDDQNSIRRPLGMTGSLLEADAHVVFARKSALANLRSCLAKAGAGAQRLMSAALAVGVAVTTEDERDLGVVAMDWGCGSCDYAVFQAGAPFRLRTVPCGGSDIDRDIAKIFRIPLAAADKLKRTIGSAVQVQVDNEAAMEVTDADGKSTKSVEPHVLSMTIQPRIDEMLDLIKRDLGSLLDKERLPGGIVLTGGLSQLPGIVQIINDEFAVPVRIGRTSYRGEHAEEVAGPESSVALGLLRLWMDQHASQQGQPLPVGGLAAWLRRIFSSDPSVAQS